MHKFLVLMINADPYCGGDYMFYDSEEDMIRDFKQYCLDVTHIFDVSNNRDIFDDYNKYFT